MKRIPCATYRLQFNRDFTFQQAAEILDYLDELGISDVYASPLFEAGPESTHGYDTCSFERVNSNLGAPGDFENFTADLKKRGLGLLLDFVPNHMSATLANPWWFNVLENGRASRYAEFFDINWQSNNPELQNKVLLPVLEDDYRKVLKGGKLRLTFENGKFHISYHERNFPVNPASVPPGGNEVPETVLKEYNGTAGDEHSFDKLDALIRSQHYRLAYWKLASQEINYRRFFDVTEMVALKMERPEVFQETHKLVFEWIHEGKVTGLRIDHPDGLWDPKQYLERLQREGRPIYVTVEKILSGGEQLPNDWLADGTTGYDFLNRVNGLFVDRAKALSADENYREFAGNDTDFDDLVYHCRKKVLERSFASELDSLARRLNFAGARGVIEEAIANFPVYRIYITETTDTVSAQDRAVVREAVEAARARAGAAIDAAAFDFLERILLLESADLQNDREFVMKFQQLSGPAMAKGLEDTAFYQFNRLISLNEVGGEPSRFGVISEEFHEANRLAAKRWPHTMLALATHDTKRGEDVRARLNVLSEIPGEWREAVVQWSKLNANKKTVVDGSPAPDANDEYLFYQTLVGALPTDIREPARLKAFRSRVVAFMLKAIKEAKVHTNWTEPNAVYEKTLQDFVERVLGDGSDGAFIGDIGKFAGRVAFFGRLNSLSQTLLKLTSPGVPDTYQGCELWDLSLVDPDNRRPVDYAVRQELLVELKRKFAAERSDRNELFAEFLRDDVPGAMKMFLIWRALNFRRLHRELFEKGNYVPVSAFGGKREHVCAFMRTLGEKKSLVVVPRLVVGLTNGGEKFPLGRDVWQETVLRLADVPPGTAFRNVLTGETIAAVKREGYATLELGEIMKTFPVALLEAV